LERGAIGGASTAVLDGLARALMMNTAEREHLYRLASQADPATSTRRSGKTVTWRPSPSLQWTLDSMETVVALIGNGRTDLLAWNTLGAAFMDEMIVSATTTPPNFARFIFLEPVARRFYPEWDAIARVNVAQLRTAAGRDPHDKQLHDLVGELSTRSDHFRSLWARHDVWQNESGIKSFHHHHVGDLTLQYNGLDLVGAPTVQLTVLAAEPGSPDHDALQILRNAPKRYTGTEPPITIVSEQQHAARE
jgi:hypothetical protein